MKSCRFHPAAEAEMAEAAAHYELRQAHLGKRFLAAVQDAVNRIQINPLLYHSIEGDVRRCLTTRFPYAVLFRVLEEQLVVIAVMHLHRRPHYWRDRGAVE